MVGLIYYLALWSAFVTAMGDVVVLSTTELDQARGGAVVWGTHWIYRLLAEGTSIAFGTFVAGGMARDRATIAGFVGGFGISLFWTAEAVFVLFVYIYVPGSALLDPWYQYLISACVAIAAPMVGHQLGRTSRKVSTERPKGFAGIPRAHFLWLWYPSYWYAAALIGPFLKFYSNGLIQWLPGLQALALYFIPLICFAVPLLCGVTLLSDESSTMRSAFRQALGAFVLIVGWGVAAAIQYGIIALVNWV